MFEALKSLSKSRKFIVAVASIAGVCILAYLGKVSGEDALRFLTVTIGALLGTIAVEDAAGKLAAGKHNAATTSVSVSVPQAPTVTETTPVPVVAEAPRKKP